MPGLALPMICEHCHSPANGLAPSVPCGSTRQSLICAECSRLSYQLNTCLDTQHIHARLHR